MNAVDASAHPRNPKTKMSFAEKVRAGALWSFGGNLASTVGSFLGGIVLARILDPSDFGAFLSITVFTSTLTMVSKFGLPQALMQVKVLDREHVDAAFLWVTVTSFAGFLLLNLIAKGIASAFGSAQIEVAVRLMSLILLLNPFETIALALLRREMRFDAVTQIEFRALLLSFLVSLVAAASGLGVLSLAMGAVGGGIVTMLGAFAKVGWRPRPTAIRYVFPLLRFSALMTLNNTVVVLTNRIDNMLIGLLTSLGQVGLYGRAFSLARIPVDQLGQSLGPLMLRSLSTVKEDPIASRDLYLKALATLSLIIFPLLAVLFVAGEELLLLLYGEKWREAAVALPPLTIAGMFTLVYIQSRALVTAQGLAGALLGVHMLGLLATIILIAAAAPLGLLILGWAIALREIVLVAVMFRVIGHHGLGITLSMIRASLLPATLAWIAAIAVGSISLDVVRLLGLEQFPNVAARAFVEIVMVLAGYGVIAFAVSVVWRSNLYLISARRQLWTTTNLLSGKVAARFARSTT
jgi:PST family polysaccharide transporter